MILEPDIKAHLNRRYARRERPPGVSSGNHLLVAFVATLMFSATATAQESVLRDRVFPFLEGSWEGVLESADGVTPCTMRCVSVLREGFLRCETCFRRVKGSCSSGEEHVYLRSSGEHAVILYLFSDDGVVCWGTLEVSGRTWAGELHGSDGSTRTMVFLWEHADSLVLTVEATGGEIPPAGTGARKLHRTGPSAR